MGSSARLWIRPPYWRRLKDMYDIRPCRASFYLAKLFSGGVISCAFCSTSPWFSSISWSKLRAAQILSGSMTRNGSAPDVYKDAFMSSAPLYRLLRVIYSIPFETYPILRVSCDGEKPRTMQRSDTFHKQRVPMLIIAIIWVTYYYTILARSFFVWIVAQFTIGDARAAGSAPSSHVLYIRTDRWTTHFN